MSLPRFNLQKLRAAVSAQQAVTKKDIRNLLLLERLRSEFRKQNQEKKEVAFKYLVRFFNNNNDGVVQEIAWVGPVASSVSFCQFLEDKIKESKESNKETYFFEEIYDELQGIGCDEVEDQIVTNLNALKESGDERSDLFLDFSIYPKTSDEEIDISISVQIY